MPLMPVENQHRPTYKLISTSVYASFFYNLSCQHPSWQACPDMPRHAYKSYHLHCTRHA